MIALWRGVWKVPISSATCANTDSFVEVSERLQDSLNMEGVFYLAMLGRAVHIKQTHN